MPRAVTAAAGAAQVVGAVVAAAVAAYALSPIDLIPDFIPVLGLLDDALIVPLGVLLAVRLVPKPLMQEYRAAAARLDDRPASRAGLVLIIAIWLCVAGLALWWLTPSLLNARSPR